MDQEKNTENGIPNTDQPSVNNSQQPNQQPNRSQEPLNEALQTPPNSKPQTPPATPNEAPISQVEQPEIVPRKNFIQGYNIKFLILIIAFLAIAGSVYYYIAHPNVFTTMAGSLRNGIFKSTFFEQMVPGSGTTTQ